jgi:hypothetical protein
MNFFYGISGKIIQIVELTGLRDTKVALGFIDLRLSAQ